MYLNYTHLTKLLAIIFPPSADELKLRGVVAKDLLALIKNEQHEDVSYILPYHNTRVRSAIHLLKFYNQKHARTLLGVVLGTYLQQHLSDGVILLPIPLSSRRYHKRGYNQVSEVIKEAQRVTPIGVLQEKVLIRTRHTKPQTSLSREKRLANMAEAFAVSSKTRAQKYITNRHIVLIDDVTTTGATLGAAKAALLPHSPASITCVALAH